MILLYITLAIFAILLHARYNGIMNHIMFYRTHIGGHPYRDYWHLCKHLSRAGLILLGASSFAIIQLVGFYSLWLIATLPGFYFVWHFHAFMKPPDKYYIVDETLKLSTKISWLDKALGFHK